MTNPYTLTFGKEPPQYISRLLQTNEILETFTAEEPSQQIFLISGIRGSGKTVLMTDISKKLKQEKNWIVADLNPETDLLQSLGAKLYSEQQLKEVFDSLDINLSLFGLGIEFKKNSGIIDIENAISRILEGLKKKKKRLLITIDEVTNNANIRKFTSAFQIFVRQDAPIFLLMTGLYENISDLQDTENLTFLYRAPKCQLTPLNQNAMINNYQQILKLKKSEAAEMASMTKGYPFAFQVLGYLTYANNGNYKDVINTYQQYLEEYVYEKIWSELSGKDKKIAYAIANCPGGKISEIKASAGISANEFNPYRKRLIRKGILTGEQYGFVSFSLPYFEEFVLQNYWPE